MKSIEDEIKEMIDRETNAWNNMDAGILVSIFHPDMVWPWPEDENSHDPVNWVCPMGRYNHDRWKAVWQNLFDTHILVHNNRTTVKINVTEEQDGAFAVVDVDTLWKNRQCFALERTRLQSLYKDWYGMEINFSYRAAELL